MSITELYLYAIIISMIRVLLCSRNGERYIAEQIDSILSQSIGDIVLHIYDDASSDGTRDILRAYKARYPERIVLTFRDIPTGSACANFMNAVHEAPDADYYMLSDQDDIWAHDKAERLQEAIRHLESTDGSPGSSSPALVFCDAKLIDGTGKELAPSWAAYQHLSPKRTALNQLLIMNQVTGGACILNRALRDILVSVPVPQAAVMHDHFIALTAAAFGRISYLDKPLYSYRQHGDNELGAQKAGLIKEVSERLGFGQASREEADARSASVYKAIFDQADEFGRLYGEKLKDRDARTVAAFASMRGMSRPVKILTVIRYGFTFDTFYRTIGEFLFI